ncbi:c-type cytochrome [Spongiimicrobium sp. 3-5]|uniref:c-type cytochrome n=1 Tax=Spongiimicrobium sp. 3-5 TaxID=3332596 RepID=UPI0039812A84
MHIGIRFVSLLSLSLLLSCGGKEEKKEGFVIKSKKTEEVSAKTSETPSNVVPASKRVDLTNKGVGAVKELKLPETIDETMAATGAELFKTNCTACHRTHKKFIGPPPLDILKRRTPEWVMNMILDPELMVKEDPLAKELLVEHNGSPMANQSLNEDEARAILEYFRTIKAEN